MKWYQPATKALDLVVRSPGATTSAGGPHVRDLSDLKRTMLVVLVALSPCIGWAFTRYGFWQMAPLFAVSYGVGLGIEWLFAVVRKGEINEGYFVTGALIPLIVPVTIPLWQLALAVAFAVVFAKEVFGGTGHNIFNPALIARAFLFFAYPAQMTGAVWSQAPASAAASAGVDAVSSATPLAVVDSSADPSWALQEAGYTVQALLLGEIPGTPGELSKLAILLGALLLLVAGVASLRIMVGAALGLLLTTALAGALTADATGLFALPPWEHLLLGGFLFGVVFMATDPVTSPETGAGKWLFGLACGALIGLIRLYSPAYVEGTMLAILLMNAFAPAIDRGVLAVQVARRRRRRRVS